MSFKISSQVNKTVGSSCVNEFKASGNYYHLGYFGGHIKIQIDSFFDRQKAPKVHADTIIAAFPTLFRLKLLYLTLLLQYWIIHNKYQLPRIVFQTKLTKSVNPLEAYTNNVAEFCLPLIQLLHLELKTIHEIFSKSVNNWIVRLLHRFTL